jgi:hypothetical protein
MNQETSIRRFRERLGLKPRGEYPDHETRSGVPDCAGRMLVFMNPEDEDSDIDERLGAGFDLLQDDEDQSPDLWLERLSGEVIDDTD